MILFIDGEYKRKLFSPYVFTGKIHIEGYEFTNESSGFSNLKSTLADIKINDKGYATYKYIKVNSGREL